ncbi:unnamed protein product [Linum tenue]|uniref:Uncharacterized protein n=1 Tax=Linum tenue TaxID=586396 RepID=A0AAV0J009_9ROSI|nr:unnamed protein product [Linum tenue]
MLTTTSSLFIGVPTLDLISVVGMEAVLVLGGDADWLAATGDDGDLPVDDVVVFRTRVFLYRGKEGGIDVEISLESRAMEKLEKDQEFLSLGGD